MFTPKYTINQNILNNLYKIRNLIDALNDKTFSTIILAHFEKDSYAISAHASTSIEGNPLPLTDVRKLLKSMPSKLRDTEREIVNYNEALLYLNNLISEEEIINNNLSIELINKVQYIVLADLDKKDNIGKLRSAPVVVNDPRRRAIAYIPPDAKDVKSALLELIDFIHKNKNEIDPIILAGIFHKQFVIIHPYMDGNGRSTRLITKYLLANMGLNTFKLFSFENYYNQNISKYIDAVGVHGDYYEIKDDVDFSPWLFYFTSGIIDELERVSKALIQKSRDKFDSRNSKDNYERIITDYIKKHGSISRSEYTSITDRSRATQTLDFKDLIERNIIERIGKGKNTYYIEKL